VFGLACHHIDVSRPEFGSVYAIMLTYCVMGVGWTLTLTSMALTAACRTFASETISFSCYWRMEIYYTNALLFLI